MNTGQNSKQAEFKHIKTRQVAFVLSVYEDLID